LSLRSLFILVYSFIFLLICFSQEVLLKPRKDALLKTYKEADSLYQAAEHIVTSPQYTEEKENELNKKALSAFEILIPLLKQGGPVYDSLSFHTFFKAGVVEHYFERRARAKSYYRQAIDLKTKLPTLPDSFLFRPWLYKGLVYYNEDLVDSAAWCFRNAEKISNNYPVSLNESERLYNNLGILYHETGNFSQARNYFEKAAAVLPASNPYYKQLLVTYKNNLASSLIQLEQYDKAEEIYQSNLSFDQNKNELRYNLATIKLNTGQYRQAIQFFNQVKYDTGKRVRVYAYTGLAYLDLGKNDSAALFFDKAAADNTIINKNRKNIPYGLSLKFKGDLLTTQKKYTEALLSYQQAVCQFYPGFTDTALSQNPARFSGVFSYINLFHALTAKGDALALLYKEQKDLLSLRSSLDAYRSAFRLADYVERTYNSDEARLFLNKIKYNSHSKPIDVCLQLYELTKDKAHLEEAYLFDQRNKASILSLNVQENEIRNKTGSQQPLFQREASLKAAITRLSLKAALLTDSLQLQMINTSTRDLEIQLDKLQGEINADPAYRDQEFIDRIPSVKTLQHMLDDHTALLSYHLSENELLILLITDRQLNYHRSTIDSDFFKQISSFKTSLHAITSGERFAGAAASSALYQTLIAPFDQQLSRVRRLIIIPDDELNYLPFEALQDTRKKYLVERFSVQYQYSTALLTQKDAFTKLSTLLAFAPFTSRGYQDPAGFSLSILPASKEEVMDLPGRIFTDSLASKSNFLQTANHNGIIHLATHASVDNEHPLRSFIAFYPGDTSGDYKLYAGEIYDMKLDSTQLIILSACETGSGQLVKGEGLMSLSRAFAYAGCPNIITSLWKAEDKTTAFITKKLHYYLGKGYTKDEALQHAKLDLLNSDAIDPRLKTPNYWAHLLFIGNYEPEKYSSRWWWIAVTIIVLSIAVFIVKKRREGYHKKFPPSR
jgi:CHAT domain-containing protein/predicted negative regulator of RcsB-dependent stress response